MRAEGLARNIEARDAQGPARTVREYYDFLVCLHDTAPRRAENAPRKLYAVDTGPRTAARLGGGDLGQRFENLVFLDLRRETGRRLDTFCGRRDVTRVPG